ncbi:MAG: hypothetical protein IJP68_00855 [Selenomonadaceae bacterium]|nr:hypothetical protein [Selenomonadaceae bacterium]
MIESIKEWAQAGDPSAMFRLSEIYLAEGNVAEAKELLAQAAEQNYLPAASKLAEIFQGEDNLPQAVKFFKQAALRGDVEAMESLVDLCPRDKEILDFVLEIIDKQYNDIYATENMFAQMMTFGSSRIGEYLPGQARAIERRRIKNKILRLKEAL